MKKEPWMSDKINTPKDLAEDLINVIMYEPHEWDTGIVNGETMWREVPWIERYQRYDKLFETPEEACEFYSEIIKHFKDYCLTEETNLI